MVAQAIQPIKKLNFERLDKNKTAFFLDLDGTLAEIVDRPDAITIPDTTHALLEDLQRHLNGAIAIISGRQIEEIDLHTRNAFTSVAGIHGLQRRDASGVRHDGPVNGADVSKLASNLAAVVEQHPALHLETKPASVALHYRGQPELKKFCQSKAKEIAELDQGMEILFGKMVVEIKLGKTHKGDAVNSFMNEQPFAGRMPVYVGDDVTDEYAFEVVNAADGISIKVGGEPTKAKYVIEDVSKLAEWLHHLNTFFSDQHKPYEEMTSS
jgi:trehalose 6-phosphate phosphatase